MYVHRLVRHGRESVEPRGAHLHPGEVHGLREVDGRVGDPPEADRGCVVDWGWVCCLHAWVSDNRSILCYLAGHDWCIIKLAFPGRILGFDVDTSFFTGNFAPRCSIQAATVDDEPVRRVLYCYIYIYPGTD